MNKYPKEIIEFIRENAAGVGNQQMADMVNQAFGTSYSKENIKGLKHREKITSGLTGRFPKGNVPYNKGMKGLHIPGCERSWFKKGHMPVNHRPVGSERLDKDGYVMIKVAEPRKWQLKQRYVWEKYNGPLEKGEKVIFLDGDRTHIEINNLALVTEAELIRINQEHLYTPEDKELMLTGIALARLKQDTSARRKKLHDTK